MSRARYASDPDASRGRLHAEPGRTMPGARGAFQRDRDRIVHSIAFRRLRHKTQVFVAPDGDHFRVRLTHSLEVAQIGRTIARVLGLDEDLTEALCLAHDIGHPPFGHAGEDGLNAATADVGGFDHNAQTLRTLNRLESPYPCWDGLNLSWETLEGLAKHNGPVLAPGWALAGEDAAFPLDLASHASLEAQIAAVADDIAYDNHDIDDGLRAGMIDFDELLAQPLVAEGWRGVTARYPALPAARLRGELIREQIGRMVDDVIGATRARLAALDPRDVDAVRRAGRTIGGFSAAFAEEERGFKRFMYARFYHHPRQLAVAESARAIIAALVGCYRADPALLPEHWRARLPCGETARTRHIIDFIAGMTDRYAVARYRELIGPIDMPDGL